jgi:hypothetical protein
MDSSKIHTQELKLNINILCVSSVLLGPPSQSHSACTNYYD